MILKGEEGKSARKKKKKSTSLDLLEDQPAIPSPLTDKETEACGGFTASDRGRSHSQDLSSC